jgi:hypothetical protein
MTREEVIEKKEFPVLVVDRPCGLELFHVSTEEPTSEGPPPELWKWVRHRTRLLSPKRRGENYRAKLGRA